MCVQCKAKQSPIDNQADRWVRFWRPGFHFHQVRTIIGQSWYWHLGHQNNSARNITSILMILPKRSAPQRCQRFSIEFSDLESSGNWRQQLQLHRWRWAANSSTFWNKIYHVRFFWHFWGIFIVFHIGYFWAVFAFLGIWGVLGIMLKDSWLKLVVGRVTEGVLSLNNPNKP